MRMLLAVIVAGSMGCTVGGEGGGGGGGGGGDDEGVLPDAGPVSTIDGSIGNACTNATFDPCTDNVQCTSGNCHLFSGEFQVCTAACTPGDNSTCPVDKTGVNGRCNNMGICKPAVPNDCTR